VQRKAVSRPVLGFALVLLALAAGPPAAAAAGPEPSSQSLHNARYCEILEVRGSLPNVVVTVWNTIGLNRCAAAKWEAIDAAALAAERGATLVVKNGPRHFLMDSATAAIGRTHTFGGIAMRKVATIPIHTAAELTQTPYTERTIERRNIWTWNAGRRVYELLAPDGSNYVMQSYAQIRDPDQTIADLRSLGDRLALPPGWSYRVRRLKHDLTLRARGQATVIQDDLQNTYQRIPRKPARTEQRTVDLTGSTRSVGFTAPSTIQDQGTVMGRPFGDGTIDLLIRFAGWSATGSFRIDAAKGSVFGTVDMDFVISGSEITFNGTADFTGGTGRYRGIRAEGLTAVDHNTLDGQNGTFTLDGVAEY
jgi:hypothetical protein